MNSTTVESWRSYRDAVREVYDEGERGGVFRGFEVEEYQLDLIVERSDQLGGELIDQIRSATRHSPEAAELETATLAAAAVDAAVGAETISTFADAFAEEAGVAEEDLELPEEVVEGAPWPRELEPIDSLLARGDAAFGADAAAAAGAASDQSPPGPRAERAIDDLVESGAPVAARFGKSVIIAGAGWLLAGLVDVDSLQRINNQVTGRIGRGFRLLGNVTQKLLGLLQSETSLELQAELGLEDVQEALKAPLAEFRNGIVERAVRVEQAKKEVARLLAEGEFDDARSEHFDAELVALCMTFKGNMRSTGAIAKALKKAALGVILVGGILGLGPGGAIAIASVNAIGLTYCVHALGDRLGTIRGWVPGVPGIVEANLVPGAPPLPTAES